MPRTRTGIGAAVMVALLAMSAPGCPRGPEIKPLPTGGLVFAVDPENARVYVNDQLQGTAGTWSDKPLLLRPGSWRVKLVAEGYYTEYLDVEVGEEVRQVDASLVPVPEPLGVEIQ